jgi:cytochrome P450
LLSITHAQLVQWLAAAAAAWLQVRTHPGFPELSPGAKAAIAGREATFVDLDPPEHTRFRSMFEHAFTNERCARLGGASKFAIWNILLLSDCRRRLHAAGL